jgi:hypothetical protein
MFVSSSFCTKNLQAWENLQAGFSFARRCGSQRRVFVKDHTFAILSSKKCKKIKKIFFPKNA